MLLRINTNGRNLETLCEQLLSKPPVFRLELMRILLIEKGRAGRQPGLSALMQDLDRSGFLLQIADQLFCRSTGLTVVPIAEKRQYHQ
jgi:hypothetical protein